MKAESLRLLQQAVRINPGARVFELAKDKLFGEAMIDACVDDSAYSAARWTETMNAIDNDVRTLSQFMNDARTLRAVARINESR